MMTNQDIAYERLISQGWEFHSQKEGMFLLVRFKHITAESRSGAEFLTLTKDGTSYAGDKVFNAKDPRHDAITFN